MLTANDDQDIMLARRSNLGYPKTVLDQKTGQVIRFKTAAEHEAWKKRGLKEHEKELERQRQVEEKLRLEQEAKKKEFQAKTANRGRPITNAEAVAEARKDIQSSESMSPKPEKRDVMDIKSIEEWLKKGFSLMEITRILNSDNPAAEAEKIKKGRKNA